MENINHSLHTDTKESLHCYHCGEVCAGKNIQIGDKIFCCNGCKLVYELLKEKDLCAYYSLTQTPGSSPPESGIESKYGYLDDKTVKQQLISFSDGTISKITFKIPAIHCSSCIWLLENLYRVDAGIIESKVNYLRKELSLSFREEQTNLRKIVEVLTSIGYEPEISLATLQKEVQKSTDKELYLQIGVAGFAFGNIMLLSFPEYLATGETIDKQFLSFFGYLSIFLALPVLFYSSMGYFRSAYQSLKQKTVNMDVPISIGILTLFARSLAETFSVGGVAYLDSFAGLVFLLLIGKLFQKKTYDTLSFDRDYRSYFPLSVTRKTGDREESISLQKLKIGDRIVLTNKELIPADAVLIKGPAFIDYSFVTGESKVVNKVSGDMIYAGGMHLGSQIELEIVKEVSQSYLTQLWNEDAFSKQKEESRMTTLANVVSKYFTFIVLTIAALAAMYWLPDNVTFALNAFTAVLIVACPCALALSTPFTLGNTLRIFGKNKFYLKNVSVIETLSKIKTIVFDKTGTLTYPHDLPLEFISSSSYSAQLNGNEKKWIRSLAKQSTHPLSKRLYLLIDSDQIDEVTDFIEVIGKGLQGTINGYRITLGSAQLILPDENIEERPISSRIFVKIDDRYRGFFNLPHHYRQGIREMINKLKNRFKIFMITGDNDSERENLVKIFSNNHFLLFDQTPYDKLDFIKKLQVDSEKVLMIGDGLNDAGALKQSDAGISIAEDINTFTPASDGILDAGQFKQLPQFLSFSRLSVRVIIISFLISFLYNLIGLFFAVQGTLSPLIAAILMPLSSLTVVVFTIGSTTFIGKKMGLKI